MADKYKRIEPKKRVDKYFWGDPWVVVIANRLEIFSGSPHCCVEIKMAKEYGTWVCTRNPKHLGPHVASTGAKEGNIRCIWDDEGNYQERGDLVLEQEDA